MCGAFAPVLLSIFQAKWVIILIRCGTVVKSFPLLGGQMSPSGMAFGFGTILATGFVHMLGASISYFSNPCLSGAWADYSSWGMVFCLIAILFMQIFDYIIETVLHRKKIKRAETAKEAALAAKVTEQAAADKVVPNVELDAEAGCLEGCAGPSQPAQEYMHEVAVKDLELTGHHFVTDVRIWFSHVTKMIVCATLIAPGGRGRVLQAVDVLGGSWHCDAQHPHRPRTGCCIWVGVHHPPYCDLLSSGMVA